MSNKIIKSKTRVHRDGEVFTPNKTVKKMLNLPGIKEKVSDIRATFMEPSAGEGAFLTAILKTKMKSAFKLSNDSYHYNRNSLVALASLYGIELLEDNISRLVINMYTLFKDLYIKGISKLDGTVSNRVLRSAKFIVTANVVQGNALSGINGNNNKIVLSEWKYISKYKVQRINHYYKDIINSTGDSEQMDLFGNNKIIRKFPKYLPVDITDVYKQLVVKKVSSDTDN